MSPPPGKTHDDGDRARFELLAIYETIITASPTQISDYGSVAEASTYVAVIVTAVDGIVAVVGDRAGFARI